MAYAATNNRGSAALGVAAIHAGLGLVIITGLAGGVIIDREDTKITSVFTEKDPPPPPPEPDQPKPQEQTSANPVYTPPKDISLTPVPNPIETTSDPVTFTKPVPKPVGMPGLGGELEFDPPPVALFDPVAPAPRNAGWVTDNDYKSSWIRRGWEGTAGIRLTIGTNGRVESCTITESTGHAALDNATCALVKRRAKFSAAKNNQGETVSGKFSSAVRWQIPD